jgi:predicted nucleic acid-binding protein
LPDESAISAVTIAELQVGVHAAADTDVRDYDMVEGVAGLSVLRV